MRERVALHGGTLRAGPGPGGGWLVEAVLRTAAPRRGGVAA
jgi:signal transduction histidine kinase